jgi:hypothetical protein
MQNGRIAALLLAAGGWRLATVPAADGIMDNDRRS